MCPPNFKHQSKVHVHVFSTKGEAKFWFEPQIEMVKNKGHNLLELHEIATMIEEHQHELVNAWKHHFGCKGH